MPTALIADDDLGPRQQLRHTLRSIWPDLQVVAECASGTDAWDAFLQHEPQVCFLDVRMPGLTGIEVAQHIGMRAQTAFVIAPTDHARSAFDNGPLDYIVKPIEPTLLATVVAHLQARLRQPDTTLGQRLEALDRLAGQVRKPMPLEVLEAGSGREPQLVRADKVVFFESDARYTRVVHDDGETLVRTPLKDLLAQLDAGTFWQIHRNVIVNRRCVDRAVRLGDDSMVVTLRGRQEQLPVSRHFQPMFLDAA